MLSEETQTSEQVVDKACGACHDSMGRQQLNASSQLMEQANTAGRQAVRLRYGGKAGVSNIQSQSLVDLDIANKRW